LVEKKSIIAYQESCTDTIVDFEVIIDSDNFSVENTVNLLKLSSTIKTSNMHAFDKEGRIKKYDMVSEIEEEHFIERMKLYEVRRNYQLKVLEHEFKILNEKCRFFNGRLDGSIKLEGQNMNTVLENLKSKKFNELGKTFNDSNKTFEYLTNIKIFDVTNEKMEKLISEKDNKNKELIKMKNISIKEIYIQELQELEKCLNNYFQ